MIMQKGSEKHWHISTTQQTPGVILLSFPCGFKISQIKEFLMEKQTPRVRSVSDFSGFHLYLPVCTSSQLGLQVNSYSPSPPASSSGPAS